MKTVLFLSVLSFVFVTGCAARNKDVIIDPTGVDMAQYQNQLGQCLKISEQVNSKAGAGAVGGALVGGLIGVTPGNQDTAKRGADVGAITGTARGARATQQRLCRTKLENDLFISLKI